MTGDDAVDAFLDMTDRAVLVMGAATTGHVASLMKMSAMNWLIGFSSGCYAAWG